MLKNVWSWFEDRLDQYPIIPFLISCFVLAFMAWVLMEGLK